MSANNQLSEQKRADLISDPNTDQPPRLWCDVLIALPIGIGMIWASEYIGPSYEKIRSVVLELGIGFVVGAIVAVTIESYMRRKQGIEDRARKRKMEANIFLALFRTALPDDLVHEMYQMLFTRRFVRQKLKIEMMLRPLTQEEQMGCSVPDALVLTQTVTYDAKNISDGQASHHVSPQEYTLIPHPTRTYPFTMFSASCPGLKPVILNSPEDFACCVTNPDKGIWHYLKAPKVEVPENGVVTVVSTVELICRKTDIKTWLTYYPAEHLKLTVSLHKELQGQLEFAVDQSHRLSLEPFTETGPEGTMYGWKLEKPILPHQGIVLYWRPMPGWL